MANTNDPGEAAVPAGFRLGDGWIVPTGEVWCTYHDEHLPPPPASYDKVHGGAACADCAIQAGALVSLDPPPVVPPMQPCTHGPGEHPDGCDGDVDSSPAPVPMEATRISAEAFEEWRRQPTTPAEPAKAPLSERLGTIYQPRADLLKREVAALEAELGEAKSKLGLTREVIQSYARDYGAARAEVEQLRAQLADRDTSGEDWLAERLASVGASWKAEVEQLKAKLAEETEARLAAEGLAGELVEDTEGAVKREADARVLAMRQFLERVPKYVREDRAITPGATRLARLADEIDGFLRAIPTSTGPASGAGGEAAKAKGAAAGDDIRARSLELLRAIYYAEEVTTAGIDAIGKLLADADRDVRARADAIKAAVDKANNRAADALEAWGNNSSDMRDLNDVAAWLRSGAPAPGMGKDGGK